VRHRHLVDGVGLTTAAIDDILDRGTLDDWIELRDAAKRNEAIAEMIAHVCRAHVMYGSSPLWIEVVNRLNEERR
jgi:hypothetical protein